MYIYRAGLYFRNCSKTLPSSVRPRPSSRNCRRRVHGCRLRGWRPARTSPRLPTCSRYAWRVVFLRRAGRRSTSCCWPLPPSRVASRQLRWSSGAPRRPGATAAARAPVRTSTSCCNSYLTDEATPMLVTRCGSTAWCRPASTLGRRRAPRRAMTDRRRRRHALLTVRAVGGPPSFVVLPQLTGAERGARLSRAQSRAASGDCAAGATRRTTSCRRRRARRPSGRLRSRGGFGAARRRRTRTAASPPRPAAAAAAESTCRAMTERVRRAHTRRGATMTALVHARDSPPRRSAPPERAPPARFPGLPLPSSSRPRVPGRPPTTHSPPQLRGAVAVA